MAYLEKHLSVKRSKLPSSGKGLFTTIDIPKGTRIVEYKGKRKTWKEVNNDQGNSGYIFYINRNNVIDALETTKALGRYANDASGLSKVKGLNNNSKYETDDNRVYIEAFKDISAGSEILVGYGKEYWDVIKYNKRLDDREKARKEKAKKKK